MRRWFKRNGCAGTDAPVRAALSALPADEGLGTWPRSHALATAAPSGFFRYGEFVDHPQGCPSLLFPLFRFLREHVPDV